MAERMTLDNLAALMQEGLLELKTDLQTEMRSGFAELKTEQQEMKAEQAETNIRLGRIETRQNTEQSMLDNQDRRITRVEKHLDLKPIR